MSEKYNNKTDLEFVLDIINMYRKAEDCYLDSFSTATSDEKEIEETVKNLKEEAKRRFSKQSTFRKEA